MGFRDVIGHRRLISLLERSIVRDTLPPSVIFAGPRGIGKRLTAIAVAQALNCTSTAGSAEAGHDAARESTSAVASAKADCSTCSRIARGVHPDVLTVEPGETGSIKVDPIRDVIARAAYRPFEARRRVSIVDDADAMQAAAQSALLKTLEEPPPSSVFILVTSRPDMLLPTVRSRCPMLRFRPLSIDDVAAGLVARGVPEGQARAVATTADGSLGRAIDAAAGDLVEARTIAHQVLAGAAASSDPRARIESAKALLAGTGAGAAADRERVSSYLRAMAALLRDMEAVAVGADRALLANADVAPSLERLAPAYRGDRGVQAFAAVDRALAAIERNAGVKIVADWLSVNL